MKEIVWQQLVNITQCLLRQMVAYGLPGRNHYGQLGRRYHDTKKYFYSDNLHRCISGSVGFNHSLVLKTDGSLWAFGSNSNGQLGDAVPRHKEILLLR